MLKIIVNNQEVDLGDIKGIDLQYNGGVFEFEQIVGSYSIPFSLPLSPTNNKIFEFPYLVNVADNSPRKFNAQIWVAGLLMASGILEAANFEKESFSCSFYVDNGDLFSKYKDVLINANNLGEDFKNLQVDPEKTNYDVNTDLFVIYPVYNEDFAKNIPLYATGISTKYQNGGFGGVYSIGYKNFITPFPLLWQTLKLLFNYFGFVYFDNFFTSTILRSINIFSIHDTKYIYYINPTTGDVLLGDEFNLAEQLPPISVGEFLFSIQNYFNIFFNIKLGKVTTLDRNVIIQSTDYVDLSNKLSDSYTKILFKKSSGWILHALKDSGDSMVSGCEDFTKYDKSSITETLPFIDQGTQSSEIAFFEHKIFVLDFVEELPSLLFWKEYIYPEIAPTGGTLINNALSMANQSSFFDGNRETEINFNITPVANMATGVYDHYINCQPWVAMPGNLFNCRMISKFNLRLSIFKGVQNVFCFEDNNIVANERLLTNKNILFSHQGFPFDDYYLGAKGSYEFHWKNFIPWYQNAMTEEYVQYIQLSPSEIKNFDFTKKYKMYGNLWFIKSFSVQITRTEVLPIKAIMIKANY